MCDSGRGSDGGYAPLPAQAVIYTYLKHANELHDEEQGQRVERFRHYSHHRLYQSTEVCVPRRQTRLMNFPERAPP